MPDLESLLADALFLLASITWLQIIDLGLVTVILYLLLRLVRHSRVAFLLRGAMVLVLLPFVITIFLPLPAFDWLVRGALLAILIATPVIFQPELRRLLERLGRSLGRPSFQQRVRAVTLLPVVRAVENLLENHTGALIVLEGGEELERIVETGVPVGAEVSSELLETIFHDGTPLHDGAAVVRQERVIAAGCVLPVSNRQLYAGQRRLGTRHRAAIGLSEISDALAIVVSEETGHISVARSGRLRSGLDGTALREQIVDFYQPASPNAPATSRSKASLWGLLKRLRKAQAGASIPGIARGLAGFRNDGAATFTNLGLWAASLLLALAVWAFVTQQTNPARQARVENIPLRLENVPADTAVLTELPETVSAVVKTTDALLPSLRSSTFQGLVSLAGKSPGLHRIEVAVHAGVSPVQIVAVEPAFLDLELADIISRTVEVSAELTGEESLSPAYQVRGLPSAVPAQVTVIGPAPAVERIEIVQASLSLKDDAGIAAATRIQELLPVRAIDANGREVSGVTIRPAQVRTTVVIESRPNTRTAGVQVATTGTLPEGYRLSRIRVTPSELTLLGDPAQLAAVGGLVSTLPVDLSQMVGDFVVDVPLELPPGVDALTSSGDGRPRRIITVLVEVGVVARQGSLRLSRPVEILGDFDGTVAAEPTQVELLLSGPVPTLNEIQADPRLVRVFVDLANGDLADLGEAELGESGLVAPSVIRPDGVTVQLVPGLVTITVIGRQ